MSANLANAAAWWHNRLTADLQGRHHADQVRHGRPVRQPPRRSPSRHSDALGKLRRKRKSRSMASTLIVLPGRYAVCRLPADAAVPPWATGDFVTITRTAEEISIVCSAEGVPDGIRSEAAFRCLRIAGTLEFAVVGVLASLVVPLANANIPAFAVSTFDTDYLLLKEADVEKAVNALREAGHQVQHGSELC
jgi:hypothetical protein